MGVRVAVAACVVLTLGAACDGGEPSPTTLPTSAPTSAAAPTSATPTTIPTPTPTPPALPAAARADSPAGAEAFARHYVEVLDYASRSGQIQQLEDLGACGTCRARSQGIKEFFDAGGRVEGGNLTIIRSEVIRFVENAALVNVTYNQAAGRTIAGNGKATTVPASTAEIFTFTLARAQGSWTVQKLQVVE